MKTGDWRQTLQQAAETPMHHVILAAILERDIGTLEDLIQAGTQYGCGPDCVIGLEYLFEFSVLVGNEQSFSVRPDIRNELDEWLAANKCALAKLQAEFIRKREEGETWSEKELDRHVMSYRQLGRSLQW